VAGEQERAGEHQREDRLPALHGELLDGSDVLDPGAGDDHVEPAEALERRRHGGRVGLGVGQIGFKRGPRTVGIGPEVHGQHVDAVPGQAPGHRAADPAAGAGDQGGPRLRPRHLEG
jgi:hypothetical protein